MAKFLRFKTRHNSSPKEGLRQEWDEWQVMDGRKVIGRYDLRSQALKDHPDAIYGCDGVISPKRLEMLEMLVSHDGISQHSAGLTFTPGDLAWGLKQRMIGVRDHLGSPELYATEAAKAALKH